MEKVAADLLRLQKEIGIVDQVGLLEEGDKRRMAAAIAGAANLMIFRNLSYLKLRSDEARTCSVLILC